MSDYNQAGTTADFRTGALVRVALAFVISVSALSPFTIHAQTNTSSGHLPVDRFLLIVETSRAMQRRADGSLRTVQNLVASGMRGEMHEGDSLGVWTFNESLYTGRLPTQDWSAESRRAIAGQVQKFLQSQTYEKQAHLDKVIPTMLRVVKASEFITVVLVTEGTEEIHGTPYDQQINQSFKTWASQQQEAKMPFVTVLQAKRGQFTGYAVAPAPWPVDMPPLPAELRIAKPAHGQHPAPVAKAQPPAPTVPPLIIRGKKPEPPPTTNSITQGTKPLGFAAGTEEKKADGRVDSTSQTLTNTSPSSTVPLAMVSGPPVTPIKESAADHSAGSAASPSQTSSLAEKARLEPQPGPIITQVPAPISAAAQPTPVQTQARKEDSISTQVPQSIQKTEPQPASDPGPLLTQVAVAAPLRPIANAQVLAGVVILCLLAASVFVWSRKRRSRPASHVSLITRSFDREKS
jgi:hypothetical protein